MSTANPYQAPADAEAPVEAAVVTRDASLVWLATAAAIVCGLISFAFNAVVYQMGMTPDLIVDALMSMSGTTILSIAAYSLARYVYRRRVSYSSRPFWLFLSGALVGGIVAGLFNWIRLPVGESIATCIGGVGGFIASVVLCAIERRRSKGVAAARDPTAGEQASAAAGGASIFWFSASAFVTGALATALTQNDYQPATVFAAFVIGGVSSCFLATVAYGLAAAIVLRRHRATTGSRLIAGVMFTISLFAQSLVDYWGLPEGLNRLWIFAPAVLVALVTDYLVARQTS